MHGRKSTKERKPTMQHRQILVVDDDELMRQLMVHCLELENYRITTATSGEEALCCLENHRFAVVLCDIHLGGEDGFAVLAACKSRHPQSKVILCSGDVTPRTLGKVANSGADSFLAKPFRLGELHERLRDCLDPAATDWTTQAAS
jgi:DNA-binding NtrC family response regulator